ncbi:TolA protein [Citrifermentans bremense]|uniref:TolA protein n=2 Tax=Citrifermentans bremense TaxID=60035 RepID=A0A7R7IYH5_9BACT|nr:energy transducer TonB [Citrifermentans bremense]BCO11590.1 TolA protein [Citrifermentans bremense]
MRKQPTRRYPGPEGMFALSFVCHLVVFLIIAKWQFYPEFHPDETPVTYVDMVTLPVASPQAGTPAAEAEKEAVPPPPATPAAPAMVQPAAPVKPAKPAAKAPAPSPTAKNNPASTAAQEQAFNERLAKLERVAQEKRQSEVLERLRKRGSQPTGMPGGKGSEAGSDYPSYLQSRLKDALKEVMVSQSKSPQVIATITVSGDGRIADYHVEKGSGDPLFDDAVHRAVTLAGKSLVPPPGGATFKRLFRFRPEGVGIR